LASHQRSQPIPAKPVSQYTQSSQSHFDEASPWEPEDFGSKLVSSEDYHKDIRLRYVLGLQLMIQLQCEALVKEFKVTPLICGLVGPIWLRFVSKTGVFDDDWADNVIYDSEMQREGNNIKFTFLVYIYEFTFTLQLAMSASLLFLYEENNYSIWILMHILGLC
jgi:hypothetical protein